MNITLRQILMSVCAIAMLWAMSINLNAQVTIGSDEKPIGGALLQLKNLTGINGDAANATKGLGMPRVILKNLTPTNASELATSVGSAGSWDTDIHTGLTVYNIGFSDPVNVCINTPPGIYVWSGRKWQSVEIEKEKVISSTDKYKGANSYVARPNTTIRIPVERAYEIWEDYSAATPASPTPAEIKEGKVLNKQPLALDDPLYVGIRWQEGRNAGITTGVIASATMAGISPSSQEEIIITTGSEEGNALVAIQAQSGLSLIWQWHIWVTNDDPDIWTYSSTGADPQCNRFMDRNLGAIEAGRPGLDNITNARTTHGLYYQWGRPTPMRTYGDIPHVARNSSEQVNLTTALTTHNFITDVAPSYDWYEHRTTDKWDSRWADQSDPSNRNKGKSPFDPCPEGWRVPGGKPNSPWQGVETWEGTGFWHTNAGKYLAYTDRTITADDRSKRIHASWYAAAGYRDLDRSLQALGSLGHYWLASPDGYGAHIMYIYSGTVIPYGNNGRVAGFSVRCVQE